MSVEMDDVADQLYEEIATLQAQQDELLKACKASLKVFQGWLHEVDPRNEMGQGESRERDAAKRMIDLTAAAIAAAEKEEK